MKDDFYGKAYYNKKKTRYVRLGGFSYGLLSLRVETDSMNRFLALHTVTANHGKWIANNSIKRKINGN